MEHETRSDAWRDRLAFVAVWLPYAWLVRRFWFVTDDAYITFRFSRNLAEGHGPRYNLGDHPPVEGYSNFLWMLLCAGFERLGLNVELWPNLVASGCGTLLLLLVFRTLRRRLELGRTAATLGTALVALHPPFAVYSSSGLATMPFVLLVFATFERLVLRRGGIAPLSAGLVALALALMRVEGVYWALFLFGLGAVARILGREPFLGAMLRALGLLVAGYGAYWIWRWSYYEQAFANTVYAKAGMTALGLGRGLDYVLVNVLTHLTHVLSLVALPCALRRGRRAVGIPVAVMALVFYAYAVVVTGDFMSMGRFLLPGWPFTALLFGWLAHDLLGPAGSAGPARRAAVAALGAGVLLVGVLPAWDVHLTPHAQRQAFHFRLKLPGAMYGSEYEQWELQRRNGIRWAVLGRSLARWLPPGTRVVHGVIGAVGYYSNLFLYDRNGLVTREVAMREFEADELSTPGHDKTVPWTFFLDERFDPDVVRVRLRDGLPDVGLDGRTEALARQHFTASVRDMQLELEATGLASRFVLDFRPVPDWEACGPNHYVVFDRRIAPGRTRREEVDDLVRRLKAYERGRDDHRAVADDGYPRPLSGAAAPH